MDNNGGIKLPLENDNIGTVQISDNAVAMIASLAVAEVEGVVSLAGNVTNELMSKVGVKKLTKGVKVEISGDNAVVNLALILEYGYPVKSTCQTVQSKVKTAIENMTGLNVSDVNIRITGVKVQ